MHNNARLVVCTLAMSSLGHWPEHGHIRVTEFICVFVSLIPDLAWHPQTRQCCCQRSEVCDARNWIIGSFVILNTEVDVICVLRWACIEDYMKKRCILMITVISVFSNS
jgi:hypothetical protein